mgnify:CR=1 FL=1
MIGSSPVIFLSDLPTTSRAYCTFIESVIEPSSVYVNKVGFENAVKIKSKTEIEIIDS